MAQYKRIRVMISSRIRTRVGEGGEGGGVEIGLARQRLKETLEAQTLFGLPLFEVWTSESPDDQSLGLTEGAWKKSLAQVREADVVLVLFTGEAGWAPPNKNQGICHAEFLEAWNGERPKLKVVRVLDPVLTPRGRGETARDKHFRADFERYNPVSPEAPPRRTTSSPMAAARFGKRWLNWSAWGGARPAAGSTPPEHP